MARLTRLDRINGSRYRAGKLLPRRRLELRCARRGSTTFTLEPPSTIFKLYPCNLFLNPLFQALADGAPPDGPLHVRIPQIPHLDQGAPRTAREARYSAQAVATLATNYPATYASFTDPTLHLDDNAEFDRLMQLVTVSLDPGIPTRLDQTYVEIQTADGEHGAKDAAYYLRDLRPWSRAHASELLVGMPSTDWVAEGVRITLFRGIHRRS